MASFGKATWGSDNTYNTYFSTYFSGDVDIYPQLTIDISGNATTISGGTGDLIIRNGSLYLHPTYGTINNIPISYYSSISSLIYNVYTISGYINSLSGRIASGGGTANLINYTLSSQLIYYTLSSSLLSYTPTSAFLSLSSVVNTISAYIPTYSTTYIQPQINTLSSIINTISAYIPTYSTTYIQPQINTLSSVINTISAYIPTYSNTYIQPTLTLHTNQLSTLSSIINTISANIPTYSNTYIQPTLTLHTNQLFTLSSVINTISAYIPTYSNTYIQPTLTLHTNQLLTLSSTINTISSSLINYVTNTQLSSKLQNYTLSSAIVGLGSGGSSGNTFSNGITITSGDIIAPCFITSLRTYSLTFGYYGSNTYQLYTNTNALLATVIPAPNYFGNITITTPVAYDMISYNIPANSNSNFSNSIGNYGYTTYINKNGSLWKTVALQNITNSVAQSLVTGNLRNSASTPQTGDYGQFVGFASVSFIPDYNVLSSDTYTVYLSFNVPSYYLQPTSYGSSTYNYINVVFNFPSTLLGTAANGYTFKLLGNANVVGNFSNLFYGSNPTTRYSSPVYSDVVAALTGLSGTIACQNAVISNNIYLGGTTSATTITVPKKKPTASAMLAVQLAPTFQSPVYTVSVNTISAAVDLTYNTQYDENCFVDGYLAVNNISNLGCNLISGDLVLNTVSGSLTNTLYCYNYANFYYQLFVFDTTPSTTVGTGALQVLGGGSIYGDLNLGGNLTMNFGNLTIGGDILTTLGPPADVRALGYQVYTYTSTVGTLVSSTWFYSGLSFAVTSANYGTYLIEFTAGITTSNTANFIHGVSLSTSSSTPTPPFNTAANNSYFMRQYLPGGSLQLLRVTRTCSLYTTQTIYGMVFAIYGTGTGTMNNASLNVTRIA